MSQGENCTVKFSVPLVTIRFYNQKEPKLDKWKRGS